MVFVLLLMVSIWRLHSAYVDPDTGKTLDFVGALYAVFTLLQFETPLTLPEHWLTRIVFFAVPIAGVLVLGQGIIRIGSAIFNVQLWSRAMAGTYKDHVIVCGLGKVSIAAIRWLRDLNEEVVCVEINPANPFIDEARALGALVVIGDATHADMLAEVGIVSAESIVPCTNNDLVNLSIALEARRLVPGIKVVLRMIDHRMAENLRSAFDLPTAFSISEICAPAFAAAATRAPLDHAFSFGEGKNRRLFTITKFIVLPDARIVGSTVADIENEFDVAVIAHQKGDAPIELHPRDHVKLEALDKFVVSASLESLNRLASVTPPFWEVQRREGRSVPS